MIQLNESLSEFSYGYGITQEIMINLESIGLKATPFFPNLVAEKKFGFDVSFKTPGTVLFLQFKLGQSLKTFVKTKNCKVDPKLKKPFFRFFIETSEVDGQYQTLVKAQEDGAETYYVAPRFVNWTEYEQFFQDGSLFENSLLIQPFEIQAKLAASNTPAGRHRICYDHTDVAVCSEPKFVDEVLLKALVERMEYSVVRESRTLGDRIRKVHSGLDERRSIRHHQDGQSVKTGVDVSWLEKRRKLFVKLVENADSRNDATTAALGFEAWRLGIQMIMVQRK